ncbi:MAG: hypothetical protein WCO71_07790, partial [Pseudomonadota bacterium]
DGACQNVAKFSTPEGLALDAESQILYVADFGIYNIRAIDLGSCTVSKLAGNGSNSWTDGATTNSATGTNRAEYLTLVKIPAGCTTSCTTKRLYFTGLYSVNSSPMTVLRYVDLNVTPNQVVTQVQTTGGYLNTGDPASSPSEAYNAKMCFPKQTAWDGKYLIIPEYCNHGVRRMDPITGTIQPITSYNSATLGNSLNAGNGANWTNFLQDFQTGTFANGFHIAQPIGALYNSTMGYYVFGAYGLWRFN